MKANGVMILDFGSQYTKLIARRVREESIYSEIFPHSVKLNQIKNTLFVTQTKETLEHFRIDIC